MKILAVVLIVVSGLLTGCIVAEPDYRGDQYRSQARGERDRDVNSGRADRDGDGVRNSQDRRPDDPRRY